MERSVIRRISDPCAPDLERIHGGGAKNGEAVRARSLEYLDSQSESGFDRKIKMPAFGPPLPAGSPPRPPMEVPAGALLLNTLTHLFQHVGEISYIRGLKRGMDK